MPYRNMPTGDDQRGQDVNQRFSNDLTDQNLGYTNAATNRPGGQTALEHKDRLPWSETWQDDQLNRIPIFDGSTLEEGGLYLDLRDLGRGIIKASGGEAVQADDLLVAAGDVSEDVWDRLAQSFREIR